MILQKKELGQISMATRSLLSAMVALCAIWEGTRAHSMRGDIWNSVCTTDTVAASHFLSHPASVATLCSAQCTLHPACRSFTYSAARSTCWLYDHLVECSTSGIPAPGTRYFWRLSPRCPTELGYKLEDNVCYKIHETLMTWSEAKETCRMEGASLFVGDSAAKLAMLHTGGVKDIWVGAFKDAVTDDWHFVDGTRLPTDSDLWKPSQPDNFGGLQNIARLTIFGKLDDVFIWDKAYTACEIPVL